MFLFVLGTGSQNEDEWKTVVKSSYKMNYKFDTNKLAGIGVATHVSRNKERKTALACWTKIE